jgi:hypothetical protein
MLCMRKIDSINKGVQKNYAKTLCFPRAAYDGCYNALRKRMRRQ